ncbi:Glycosyl transferase 4-like domain-containing protein [Halogranum rubrum]|uniref:Glycosyl transferase 4-like domain-containing protein n=1 Tax=Halogranum rubrum TaxID=553466 RepID=A0A1I4IHG8_9EURY|nr:glycosyltransferase family 4 protein [Halogranum rubrum]SFL53758.1 Glycosyl transferase 4-like domain-containing protein [Halogranum rubrum]
MSEAGETSVGAEEERDVDAETETDLDLRVLHITTSERSFFRKQVEVLEERGVECETVVVPRAGEGRGPREYLSFYLQTLGKSLEEFDIVHANYGLTAPMALAQPVRPIVLSLWGSDVLGPSWLAALSEICAERFDAVISPSEPLSRELSVPHHQIPYGVDTDLFRPIDRTEARERVGWPVEGDIALFPYDTERDVKDFPRAERVAEEAGVDLRTVSGVDYEEMPYYFNAADALLVTSKYESGPMAVREAAACNVPVVTTPVGFAPDVLDGVSNSVVADDDDELAAGLAEIAAGDARSDGREVVDGLSLDEMGERLLEVYRSLDV